jgi:hypothetical protein
VSEVTAEDVVADIAMSIDWADTEVHGSYFYLYLQSDETTWVVRVEEA